MMVTVGGGDAGVGMTAGVIVDSVALARRPEGIVLTPNHIWTSAAILDRRTLEVLYEGRFGFTITRGPDRSIWGTGGVPFTQSGTFIAPRRAPVTTPTEAEIDPRSLGC